MFVAKFYTRASRVRIVIAKFDGRWKLPGGPYPIPELVALIGGILATLFLLPRLGQPLLTAAIGLSVTGSMVAVMRRMPYSPVKFSTRLHRITRLYTEPVSVSGGFDEARMATTVSTIQPRIDVLDPPGPDRADGPNRRAKAAHHAQPPQPRTDGWTEMFEREPESPAGLFR